MTQNCLDFAWKSWFVTCRCRREPSKDGGVGQGYKVQDIDEECIGAFFSNGQGSSEGLTLI